MNGVTTDRPEIARFVSPRGRATAVMLAPRLALGALHSIARVEDTGFESGTPSCAGVREFYDSSTFELQVAGQTRKVEKIITKGQRDVCDGDIAFLVLDQPVENIAFPQLRLDEFPVVDEEVTACGWGSFDVKCSERTQARCDVGKVLIANGGFYAPDQSTIDPGLTVSSNAMCLGDSGGALFSNKSGAMVATLVALLNPDKSKVNSLTSPCNFCDGAVALAVLLSAHRDYIATGFAAVGSAPWREGHPKPAELGETCAEALDCNSQLCVGLGNTSVCSKYCESSDCSDDQVCTAVSAGSVCLPKVAPEPASCAMAPAPVDSQNDQNRFLGSFATIAAALAMVRRLGRSRAAK